MEASIRTVSRVQVGDMTLMDTMLPAIEAFGADPLSGKSVSEGLQRLARAAEEGRDSTRDLVASTGRASRLGERSRGALAAGDASCALLPRTLSDPIGRLLDGESSAEEGSR